MVGRKARAEMSFGIVHGSLGLHGLQPRVARASFPKLRRRYFDASCVTTILSLRTDLAAQFGVALGLSRFDQPAGTSLPTRTARAFLL